MKNPRYFPSHIANFFLWLAKQDGCDRKMTNMKLLKLTYFTFAWYYTLYEEKLFDEDIEAWGHGPVIPSIYHEFKRFGKKPIEDYAVEINQHGEIYHPMINDQDKQVVLIANAIWDAYKNQDGEDLSQITHQPNSPWSNVYERGKNKVLKLEDIEKRALEAMSKYKTYKENK